ncbi:hypothetical protein ACWU4D_04430 [Vibrio sp. WJH972]
MAQDFTFLINPQNTLELIRFYFVWILLLFVVHVCWDKYSPTSSTDSWKNLKNKVSELYAAATVSSSALLGIMLVTGFKEHPLFNNDAVLIPLILSVLTGIIVGFTGLVPKAAMIEKSPSSSNKENPSTLIG